MPANLFYRYYDIVFQSKGYKEETNLVFNFSEKFGIKSPKRILEIGCGTGNHTKILAKSGVRVVAIDTDLEMVRIANEKLKDISNVNIIHSPIDQLKEKDFDLALALFNVVTYIDKTGNLIRFMQGVSDRLRKGAIFVFDCWNGVAAIRDLPRNKLTTIAHQDKIINFNLIPDVDLFNQIVTINYYIEVKEEQQTKKDHFSFSQTLWTPMQIQFALAEVKLKVLKITPLMKPKRQASDNDWKIMFLCKKL